MKPTYCPSGSGYFPLIRHLEVVARHRDDILAQPPDQDYNRDRRHTAYRQYILWRHGYLGAEFVMRCGVLLVEGCMVTCLVFNSEDYSCVICWLFTPYLILFKW
jgi:hypothetical protein